MSRGTHRHGPLSPTAVRLRAQHTEAFASVTTAAFTIFVAATDAMYALAAARAGSMLSTAEARLWTERAGGGALVVAGTATALSRA